MRIIIDTREQRPLKFDCETIKGTLNTGDYGVIFTDGHRFPVVFERKGIGDLFGSLSKGYSRFRKVFERAKEQNITLIIAIEGTKERVIKGYSHSKRNGISIIIQLETIRERYGIEHIYFKSRVHMKKFITEFYAAHEKEYENNQSLRTL